MLVNALEERGVSCWVAPRDVPAGGSYAEALLNAIESASCFVLIYSEHSNVSSHVLREVERALRFGLNIVPIRIDESTPSKSLDYLLATVHWLAIEPGARDRSIVKAVEQIVACVKHSQAPSPAALPARVAPAPIAAGPLAAMPPSPQRSQSRRSALIGGALLFVIVAGLIWFFAARNRAGGEGAKVDQNELPQPVTHRYFAFLANHKSSGAYNLLSMAFRKHVRIGNFSKNVGAKPPVRLIEAPIVSQNEHNASIAAVLEDTDPAANKARWKVPIELVLEGSVWRIDSMNGFSPWSGRSKSDAANESGDEAAPDPPKRSP